MNPYTFEPCQIPPTDLYADVPDYGRYGPHPDDFRIDPQHVNSHSADSLQYWASVLDLCDEQHRIYSADEGGRDVFALGSVIVKSSHLHTGACKEIDYSHADANEAQAILIASGVLEDVRVPQIYFAGKINGRQVLIQERLPRVSLAVAWQYLSPSQKASFKKQARTILHRLHSIRPPDTVQARTHVVSDPNILSNGRFNPIEKEIIFSAENIDPDLGFMHNDLSQSNIIVDDDRIVGLTDWEMAGFLGWRTAGEVDRRVKGPQREMYAHLGMSEEWFVDLLFWNDLYNEKGYMSREA